MKILDQITFQSYLAFLVQNILQALKIKADKSEIKTKLKNHPFYPSFLSVSDCLSDYYIKNRVVRIKPEELLKINGPLSVYFTDPESEDKNFVFIKEINDRQVIYIDRKSRRNKEVNFEDFCKYYNGLALVIDIGDGNYKHDPGRIRSIVINVLKVTTVLFALFIFFTSIFSYQHLSGLIFFILTTIGSILSSIIVWHEIDKSNPLVNSICKLGKNIDCNTVLESKSANILGFSWSTISFTFFIGSLANLLFFDYSKMTALYLCSWLSFFTLPFIVLSIYYQHFIIKKWCLLCLGILLVLTLQFITVLFGNHFVSYNFPTVTISGGVQFILLFLAAFFLQHFLDKYFTNKKKSQSILKDFNTLKFRSNLFETVLLSQDKIIPPNHLGIKIGCDDAKYKVVKVCNPYCGPCGISHEVIHHLLNNNYDIQIQIIFVVTDNLSDKRLVPIKKFLTLYEQKEISSLSLALDEWYGSKIKSHEFFTDHESLSSTPAFDQQILEMWDWSANNKIHSTPTFLVNDHKLPTIFIVDDLKYFLK